jgi:hypothetical protein
MHSDGRYNYTKEKCYKWLLEHPVAHPVDVAFLVKEEAEFKAGLEGMQQQAKPSSLPIGSTTSLFFTSTIVPLMTK